MNKKAIFINAIILALLAGFVVMSIVFYYLIPIGITIIKFLNQTMKDLIGIIRR